IFLGLLNATLNIINKDRVNGSFDMKHINGGSSRVSLNGYKGGK
ncbi:unnamed protein product, partial [marine sediment metagenome]